MGTWLRIPLWLVAVVGAASTIGYVASRAPDYLDWDSIGTVMRYPDGERTRVPLTRILRDLTFILMGLAFVARRPPKERNADVFQLVFGGLGACLPILPYLFDGLLGSIDVEWRNAWRPYFMERSLIWWRTAAGVACLVVGNAIDVWAYSVLFRSFSVVAEARALVTRGPYRFVRHPVYFGQIIAQAGLWLFFASAHGGWVAFYLVFVSIQLYRSRAEERVLEAAFGDDYRAFAERAWWFWKLPPSSSRPTG